MKEYSLIATRIMAVTPESDLSFLLPFPKSLSEIEAETHVETEAYSFRLQLPQEFVNEMFQHGDKADEWGLRWFVRHHPPRTRS